MIVDRKIVEDVWNRHAHHYNEVHNDAENEAAWRQVLDELLGEQPGVRVLDVGAGSGFLTMLLSQLGYRSHGVDLAGRMLDTAREMSAEMNRRIELVRADWEMLPYAENGFDFLVNRCIMWTLFNPEETLREWCRVLKPGGSLLCFLPAGKEADGPVPNHYAPEIEAQLSLKGTGPAELSDFLSGCGFCPSEAVSLPGLGETPLFSNWYVIRGCKPAASVGGVG